MFMWMCKIYGAAYFVDRFHSTEQLPHAVLTPKEYFTVLDTISKAQPSLISDLQKKLQGLLPQLKVRTELVLATFLLEQLTWVTKF